MRGAIGPITKCTDNFNLTFREIECDRKAELEGVRLKKVAPEHTSNRCSTCGTVDPNNRQTGDRFECIDCGYQNHADYNAAKNVGLEYLRGSQNEADGGAPAGVRTNSGLVTHDGYQPLD